MELNRSQRLGLNLDMHIVLDAGAGTGKTACIVERVLEHFLSEDQRATRLLAKGPREIDLGGGVLVSPASEREDLREWKGLLPTEVVVLTFTVKAAEEMRDRLRTQLSKLRAGPRAKRDGLRFEPRIRNEGLVEQLSMLLDEAPIGTIDSFFNRLVSAHRGMLGERPTREQVTDAQRVFLQQQALSSVWRIRNDGHAADVGIISVPTSEFLAARNRISHQLGGRRRAQKVISKLMANGLFVDSISTALRAGSGKVDSAALKTAFSSHLSAVEISNFAVELRGFCDDWLDAVKQRATDLGLPAALTDQTRFHSLDDLVNSPLPADMWGQLLWILHVNLAITTHSALESTTCKAFPNDRLPNTNGWPSGVNPQSSIKDKDMQKTIKARMKTAAKSARALLSGIDGRRIRACAIIADLLDPCVLPPHLPSTCTTRPVRLQDPFPNFDERDSLALSAELDARMLEDMLVVQAAACDVLTALKLRDGLHDHDDTARLAGDLLLTRCPRVCRRWYPPQVVAALDRIDDAHPWTDSHIEDALEICQSAFVDGTIVEDFRDWNMREVTDDLTQRFTTLKTIRRRFRAFIIDEAQDNSNQQWTLLARLWGKRAREEGDPDEPNTPWQPTVCWVGDQKQSIYGFRQAQVSGMARYNQHLRAINEYEYDNELRLLSSPALRRKDAARDPRLVDISSFVSGLEYVNHRPIPEEAWINFDLSDDDSILQVNDIQRRASGHIDLVTNYRTCNDLLATMNEWWEDLFSPRHNLFGGDWYARAKALRASRKQEHGQLEWLLPVATGGARDSESDMVIPIDPFELGAAAKSAHLENELIATRIRALINGASTSVLGADGPVDVPPIEKVRPRDIMVLMPSRTHMADLVRRLDALGVPALADQEGGLLEQPVVKALYALLQLNARRDSTAAAAMLARSPLVGHSDSELQNYLADSKGQSDLLSRLTEHACSSEQKQMISRWNTLGDSNRLVQMLEETLDHSDLLLAHPTLVDRQYAEQFIDLVRSQMAESGGDPVLLAERLQTLANASGALLPGVAQPPSDAVRVMTIHGSKGLQSKVVVVTGLFSENQSNLGQSLRENTLVCGEMFAARIQPWRSMNNIDSASWRIAKEILTSQVQAEARRLFYVACTRAEDLLILAGSPRKATLNADAGEIEVRWDYRIEPRFGWMWLEALRQAARRFGIADAVWMLEEDAETLGLLPTRGLGEITLNPERLLTAPQLAPNLLNNLAVYHHPSLLLPNRAVLSPLVDFRRAQDSARLDATGTDETPILTRPHRTRIAPHLLDSTNECIRRYWLAHHVGISSERIRLPTIAQNGGKTSKLRSPQANELGSLFHRLVELGLPNPGAGPDGPTIPLPAQWVEQNDGGMDDEKLLEKVCDELLPAVVDPVETKALLREMARVLMDGPLGKSVNKKLVNGRLTEGLRTEWPFLVKVEKSLEKAQQKRWTPLGPEIIQNIESVIIEFDGIADLVLCEVDQNGSGTIRAIDVKSEECRAILDQPSDLSGTLFEKAADIENETHLTTAEENLLEKHRFQLYLYHLCLVRQEEMRAKAGFAKRRVLRPAIAVAASGRLISWTADQWQQIESEFSQLLERIALAQAVDYADEAKFPRLGEGEVEKCRNCSYFTGQVRLCGPAGWPLGVQVNRIEVINDPTLANLQNQ